MGKTSSAVKEKYNAKTYEDIRLRVKKGQKDTIRAFAESKGMSLQGYINYAIAKDMGEDSDLPPDAENIY